MPYVEGESLRDELDREKQLPVDEAVRITADGGRRTRLRPPHDVIHRDIKPENILLHDGKPVVADFGIALAVSAAGGGRSPRPDCARHALLHEPGAGDGGPGPGRPRPTSIRWACVLYEMLTGEPPAMGNTPTEVLSHRLMGDVLPLTSRVKGLPPEVDAVIETALARDRHDRYPSAEAFAEALESTGSTLPGPALSAAPKRKKAFWPSFSGVRSIAQRSSTPLSLG